MDSYTYTHQYWLTSKNFTFINSVQTLDAISKTCHKQISIGMNGEWVSRESLLSSMFTGAQKIMLRLIKFGIQVEILFAYLYTLPWMLLLHSMLKIKL